MDESLITIVRSNYVLLLYVFLTLVFASCSALAGLVYFSTRGGHASVRVDALLQMGSALALAIVTGVLALVHLPSPIYPVAMLLTIQRAAFVLLAVFVALSVDRMITYVNGQLDWLRRLLSPNKWRRQRDG